MMKSLVKIGSGYNTAPQDAIALLNKIPAELPYSDWFRIAAALKNSGVKFEEFDKWSKTAPAKYDADEAERVWGGGWRFREGKNYDRNPRSPRRKIQLYRIGST